MPRKTEKIKDFLLTERREDAKSVKIKKNKDNVKFRVRCSRCLYTLIMTDKAGREAQALTAPRPGGEGAEVKRSQKGKKKALLTVT